VVLSITGSYRWAVAVSSGALLVIYMFVCASLIRLRKLRPGADAVRIPFGRTCAVIGLFFVVAVLSSLQVREALLLILTALIAAVNWFWVSRRKRKLIVEAFSGRPSPLAKS